MKNLGCDFGTAAKNAPVKKVKMQKKMRRPFRYFRVCAVSVASLGSVALAGVAGPGAGNAYAQGVVQPIHVTVNGDLVNFNGQQPVEKFGSVLVPLRGVFEKLGATVAYDSVSRSILAVRGATSVQIQLGSTTASVNGQVRTLTIPAEAVNGTTLVPLRFVSEALGADVRWSPASQTVIIATNGAVGKGSNGIIGTTPTAPTAPVATGAMPQVLSLTHSGNAVYRAGQILTVTLNGTPGGTATFTLPGVAGAQGVAMRERTPGVYTGAFTVPTGVAVKGATLLASIQKNGASSPMIQSSDPVTLDSVGPTLANLSPAPNASLPPGRPLIYGTYSEGISGISPGSAKLLLNGKEVTPSATITDAFFSYQPTENLPAGHNIVSIEVSDRAGNVVRRDWAFDVAKSETLVHALTFSPENGSLGSGDQLTVKLMAQPGGKANFAIGGVVKDQPMREEPAGTYTGMYTIKEGESVTKAPLTAAYVSPSGEAVTQTAAMTVTVTAGPPKAPTISSPSAGASAGGDTVTLAGTARPGATVRYEVRYAGTLLILPVSGAVTNGEVKADGKGEWRVAAVKLSAPNGLSHTTYTVQVMTVDAAGLTSEPTSVDFTR